MAFRKAEWQQFLGFLKRRFPGRVGSEAGAREVVEWLRGKIRALRDMPGPGPEEGGET